MLPYGGKVKEIKMEQKDLEKIVKLILKNAEPEEATRLIIELIRGVEKPPKVIDHPYPCYPYYFYYTNTPYDTCLGTGQGTGKPSWDWTQITGSTDTGTISGFDSVRETKNK